MKYYDFDDIPATWKDGEMPRILVNGEWVRYYDVGKFGMYAQPISKAEFDKLVGQQQATGET